MNSKVFEGINNKAEDIVNMSIDTISFFASLDVPELNDFLIASSFAHINSRNIESIKVKALKICLNMRTTNKDSIRSIYNTINISLEQIKTESVAISIMNQFFKDSKSFAKRVGCIECVDALLDLKGSDLNIGLRLILATRIIEKHYTKDSKIDSLISTIEANFATSIKKTLIDNPNRLKNSNLEVLAGILLTTRVNKLTGRLEDQTAAIA